jgi:Concanavalin A-like lectin/glucanases superfamily
LNNVKVSSRTTRSVRPQLIALAGGALGLTLSLAACSGDQAPIIVQTGGTAGNGGDTSSSGATGGTASGNGAGGGSDDKGGTGSGGTGNGGRAGSPSGGTSGSSSAGSSSAGSSSGGAAGGGGTAGSGTAGGGNGGAGGGVCPSGGAGGTVPNPTNDDDGDGVVNCLDECPSDVAKTSPGECGCNAAELDSDGDGVFDCKENCPLDAMKTEPGVCGCGASDTANADGDAAVDCKDACPRDPALTEAGVCGCLPESLGALCLAHRYQFGGTGTVVTDSIAGASGDGTVVGATLTDTGTLVLAGGTSDQYVKLPSRLISSLGDSATIEAWVTWTGTGEWQRIFDFGSSDAGEGMQGAGRTYLFLTPRAGGGGLRAAISPYDYTTEDQVGITTPLPATLSHVAVVIDGKTQLMSLYQDGVSQGTPVTIRPEAALTRLNDVNNWLGRSQYQPDDELAGTFHEVRIYSRALTSMQVAANFAAGPDALP